MDYHVYLRDRHKYIIYKYNTEFINNQKMI